MYIGLFAYLILAPVAGCLLAGVDRKITAHMQGRVGPPILQPYYDVRKLLAKDKRSVNGLQTVYITLYLLFAAFAGAIFFAGGNFLLSIFVLTLSSLFLVVAGYSARSPYADAGAEREMIQVMSYEPMVLLVAIGFYLVHHTFDVGALARGSSSLVFQLPLVFVGFIYVLTIKLRKSPFDLSTSHHAHQELVKGVTTEMSGRTLACVEIAHWYESIMFLGWVALFVLTGSWISIVVAVVVCVVIYFLEILIDNNFARVKWQVMLSSAWALALVLGFVNLLIVYIR